MNDEYEFMDPADRPTFRGREGESDGRDYSAAGPRDELEDARQEGLAAAAAESSIAPLHPNCKCNLIPKREEKMGWKCWPMLEAKTNNLRGYMIECPACGFGHAFFITPQRPGGPVWKFINGDVLSPTFRDSMLVDIPATDGRPHHRCHSYVTDGRIQFLSDCTHKLAGQIVELPQREIDSSYDRQRKADKR